MGIAPALLKLDRKLYSRECDQVAEIHRMESRSNGAGGQSKTPRQAESYSARLAQSRRRDYPIQGGQPQTEAEWNVWLCDPDRDPSEYDVLKGDVILIGSRTGEKFTVKSTNKGESDAVCLTCICTRVE